MDAGSETRKRKRWHGAAWLAGGLVALAAAGVVLVFVFWPYRYRKVHPLLEQEFQSQVEVRRCYRTYFPHPGFVADGVTFWRRGHTGEVPFATVDHLHMVGTWTGLLFTPHTLYQIWLRGVRVQIVLKGEGTPAAKSTHVRGGSTEQSGEAEMRARTDAGAAKMESSPGTKKRNRPEADKLHIETIVAYGATLDFLRHGQAPLHFVFGTLQIHNVQSGEPLTFFARARLPMLNAVVEANGKLGPLRPGHYAEMPTEGAYSLADMDLRRVSKLHGSASASGRYSGSVEQIAVQGKLAIPNLQAGTGHVERLDAAYSATVKALQRELDIESAEVRMAGSTVMANGRVAGDPRLARVNFTTQDGDLERLLEVVEEGTPSVAGKVSFVAQAEFGNGPAPFLKRLRLQGRVVVKDVTFVQSRLQKTVDAFSARARKQKNKDVVEVNVAASGETTFREGTAYLRDVRVTLPGATARLEGTFNLLNTRVNLTGKVGMQQTLSKDMTGWKRWLLAPLNPFFRQGKAGAVVPVAVTGTAGNPKIGQNLLHNR
ncbi:MAG TPA: AsmA-like C-terminal region-containing protein [Acidobacteriaceae bacterium]|nr:AsmA-like C-terminal region-containing protein [Acidobacteriaceae bacterium]